MSIINEISRTIHAIRRVHDCDIERLCFEVTEAEWEELMRWLSEHQWTPTTAGDIRAQGLECVTVLGIRVRKLPPSGAEKP